MGNKVKYNLKNVHAAKLTETVTDGVSAFTYAKPQAIPGAVSISLDAEGESSPFYADGIVYFRSVTNNGYSGDLEIALIPEWFRTEILREQLDANGVLVENNDNAESIKFALQRCTTEKRAKQDNPVPADCRSFLETRRRILPAPAAGLFSPPWM